MSATREAPNADHLSDLVGDAVCHIFQDAPWVAPADRPRALCGVPRAEQPVHGGRWPVGGIEPRVCPSCGLPRCPRCIAKSA